MHVKLELTLPCFSPIYIQPYTPSVVQQEDVSQCELGYRLCLCPVEEVPDTAQRRT